MAKHSSGKSEWKLRDARRRLDRRTSNQALAVETPVTLRFVTADRNKETLKEAYRRLTHEAIVGVAQRFKYPDVRQLTVMKGEVFFRNLPASTAEVIRSIMTREPRAWMLGKLE